MRNLILLLVAVGCVFAQDATRTDELCGRFSNEGGARRLELWGTPEQRGFAHGYLLGKEILEAFESDLLVMMMGRFARYESRVVGELVPHFDFTKDEEAELKGILSGLEARIPEAERMLKRLKRPMTLNDLKAANTAGDWAPYGCSSLALSGHFTKDGAPAVVRNFDYFGLKLLLDFQTVVVVRPEPGRFGYAGVSYPGSIGVITGMNTESVFVAIHDVPVKPSDDIFARPNVPRLVAQRRILLGTRGPDALEATRKNLKIWPTLFGNNFMVATGAAKPGAPFAAVFEYDLREGLDDGVTQRLGDRGGAATDVLASTNHHRARGVQEEPAACERYAALLQAAEARREKGALSVEELFAVASVAALPKEGRKQVKLMHGTVHQAVALLGLCELHVKQGRSGSNIRDVKAVSINVREAVKALPAAATVR